MKPYRCTRNYDALERQLPRTSPEYFSAAAIEARERARRADRLEEVRLTKERHEIMRAAAAAAAERERRESEARNAMLRLIRKKCAWAEMRLAGKREEEERRAASARAARAHRAMVLRHNRLRANRKKWKFGPDGKRVQVVAAKRYVDDDDSDCGESDDGSAVS